MRGSDPRTPQTIMARSTYTIPSMDCPAEEAVIRNGLRGIAGVEALEFDLFNRRLLVTHSLEDDAEVVAALRRVGMEPARDTDRGRHQRGSTDGNTAHPRGRSEVESREQTPPVARRGSPRRMPVATRREVLLLGASGVLALAAELIAWSTKTERSWPVLILSAAAIVLGGLPTLRKGLIALRTFALNINFLMTIAVTGAFAVGEYPEAAVVVFLFAVAELIEKYSLERARNAVRALMEMAPDVASVKQPDGSWAQRPAAEVAVGAILRVRPGERLPLDGVVVAGASAVNQAPITGESAPVDKAEGDQVFAGTINESGVLEFSTSGGTDQTTLARIIRTVQEAQGQRAPTQRFVDRFARVYTPIVCVLAMLVAVVPWALFREPFMPWLYKALVLLVIACPCALVISTPVTIVSGLAAAAKRGILVKGGVYLEGGRRLRVVALDKTGTVTEGRPRLTDVRSLGTIPSDELLRLAASLDAGSDHPVARAVTAAWDTDKAARVGPLFKVENFSSITGRGVTGVIDGRTCYLGNHRLAHERGVCSPAVEAVLGGLEAKGWTAVVLSDDRAALGVLSVADTPRESSVHAVRDLHALGIRTVMLSGDNQMTAAAIAKAVGIDDARGNLLPDDKVAAVNDLLSEHGQEAVGMVGDGVNDAPALAQSSIGFAMGAAGTDVALETADVALMRDDPRGVPEFIRLSRRTAVVLKQNITLALGIKVVFFGLALAGIATLWMAVVADLGASLLVVGNGLRLLRGPPRGPNQALPASDAPRSSR
jgi:Zn2+/Cd2+-exporting ATPase